MSDINKEIGARIASRLAQSGKSQADLAAYMNVTHSAVSSWVAGDKVPRLDKIDKICITSPFVDVNISVSNSSEIKAHFYGEGTISGDINLTTKRLTIN